MPVTFPSTAPKQSLNTDFIHSAIHGWSCNKRDCSVGISTPWLTSVMKPMNLISEKYCIQCLKKHSWLHTYTLLMRQNIRIPFEDYNQHTICNISLFCWIKISWTLQPVSSHLYQTYSGIKNGRIFIIMILLAVFSLDEALAKCTLF